MHIGVIVLDSDGRAIRGDGFLELSLEVQGETEVEVGFAVIRLQSDRLAELGDRLVQPALVL
jgi:hypothetical protein